MIPVPHRPAYEVPAFLGAFYVSLAPRHLEGISVSTSIRTAEVTAKWNRGEWRTLGRADSRNSLVVVRSRVAWPARAWWWWRQRRWVLEEIALRFHFLRAPYDGCYYRECRFDPPDLWGRPLEWWETV